MHKKSILAAATAGATALAVLGLTGPVQAADAIVYATNGVGYISYDDQTVLDRFRIYDGSNDNSGFWGYRGELRSGGGTLLAWDYVSGIGSTTTFDYDLAKGKQYIIKVCLAQGALGPQSSCASKVISDS